MEGLEPTDPVTAAVANIFECANLVSEELRQAFETEFQFIVHEKDVFLQKYNKSRLKPGKRKLHKIAEEEDNGNMIKRNRPSEDNKENFPNNTFVLLPENGNTSTPNEKTSTSVKNASDIPDDKLANETNSSPLKLETTTRSSMDKSRHSSSVKLMPPPTVPIKKKRTTNRKYSKINEQMSDNDQPRQTRSRRKDTVSSVLDETTSNTRVTRSKFRNMTNESINETRSSSKSSDQDDKVIPKLNKTKSRKNNLENPSPETSTADTITSENDIENVPNTDDCLNMPMKQKQLKSITKTNSQDTLIKEVEICSISDTINNDDKNVETMDVDNVITENSEFKNTEIEVNKINANEPDTHNLQNESISASPKYKSIGKKKSNEKDQNVDELLKDSESMSNTITYSDEQNDDKVETPLNEINNKKEKNFDETIIIKAKQSKSNASQAKAIPFDVTITLPSKNINEVSKIVNETITINKDNQALYNASASLLPDDLSEIYETPSKIPTSIPIKKNITTFESPVKSAVKHFEKLAESYKVNNVKSNALKVNVNPIKDKNQYAKIISKIDSNLKTTDTKKTNTSLNKIVKKANTPNIPTFKQKKMIDSKISEAEEKRKQEEKQARMLELKEKEKMRMLQQKNEIDKNTKNIKNKDIHVAKDMKMKKDFLKYPVVQPQNPSNFEKMIEDDEEMERNNKSEEEKQKFNSARKPLWAKGDTLDKLFKIQNYINIASIDKLYQTTEFRPNLQEIFPGIDVRKLKRSSSAMWTVPRCSMMSKE